MATTGVLQVFSKSRPSTFCHRELFSASITSRPVPLVRQVWFLQRLLCVTGNRSGHLPRGQGAYYRADLAPANTIERSWTNNREVRKVWLGNNARGKDQLETNPPKGQKYLEGAKNISVGT